MNSLNHITKFDYLTTRKAALDVNIENTLYFAKKRQYQWNTRINRHRWARRKHLYNWISLSNIVKDWAKTYRFYRKYSKFVFNQHFTKNSIIAHNLVLSMNSIPGWHKGTEDVVAATITRKVILHFASFNNPRLKFFLSSTHLARMVMSYSDLYSNRTNWSDKSPYVPLFDDNLSHVSPYRTELTPSKHELAKSFLTLQTWPFVKLTLSVKALYSTLVILLKFHLN